MFKKIDLFGQPVFFKFNGSEKSKSSAGAWFSLFLFGFVLWAIYNVGQDIVYRRNPKIIMSEGYSEDPKPMVLSAETFSFAAGLQVPITYAHYINESIYKLEAHFTRMVREFDENGTLQINAEYINLELERCTKDHFGIHGSKFENLELSELYCLKKEQPGFDQIILQGTFESPLFQDIELIIKPCDPETSNVTCAPEETLNEMLGSCYFAIYYTNLAIDAKNSTYPNFTFRDSYYTTVSNSFFKDVPIWLTHVQLKSDFGWLLETENVKNFVRVGYVGESASFLQKNQKRMINVRIRMDKITINYERSYLKMGDIFASANGFAATGVIIIFIFLGPYSKIKFYERLINELFDLRILRQETKENIRNRKRNSTKKMNTKPAESKKEEAKKKTEKDDVKLQVGDKSNQHSMLINEFESFSKIPYSDDENNLEKSGMINLNHLSISQLRNDQAKKPGQPIVDISDIKAVEVIPESSQSPSTRKNLRNFDPPTPSRYAAQNSEKRQAESKSTCNPATAKLKYSSGPLFRSMKPEMTAVKQKVKILEGYEPSSPVESFMMLESLIMENEADRNTPKQSYQEMSPVAARREKGKKNSKGLEVSKKVSSVRQISEEAYEDTDEELEQQAGELSVRLNKDSDRLSISFKEYLCSFFWRSKDLKAKLSLLDEGIRRIEERIDIFNVLKKFREVDKLKLLFMENEQLVLFDTLPKPELSTGSRFAAIQRRTSFTNFKDTRFISEKRKKELVLLSYKRMKKKRSKTMIDTKLLEIYDDIIKH